MITSPLGLEARLSRPPRDLDLFFWINLGAVVLFFTLLGSRFVLAPGLLVQVGPTNGAIELPQSEMAAPGAASVVVSYRRDNMVIFEGGIHELRDLRAPMEAYIRKHPGAVLLVRMDRQVSVQGFFELSALAHAVGFAHILVAAEPNAAETNPLTPVGH